MNTRALVFAAFLAACGKPQQGVPGPLPMKDPQPLSGCTGKSIFAMDGQNLTRFGADGSATQLFHFGAELPADSVEIEDWQETNGFMAAEALLVTADGQAIDRYEFVVLDPQGDVVFHLLRSGEPFTGPIHLGSDGTLAVANSTGWLAHPDGTMTDLGQLLPLEAALPGGVLPVARGGYPWSPDSEKGLLALDTMRFTALNPKPDASSEFREVAGGLMYSVGSTLVLASATGTRQISLPDSTWRVAQVAGDRFLMLVSDSRFTVLDLATLETNAVTGLAEPMQGDRVWASLADDGTVFSSVDVGDLMQLRSSSDFGASWHNVGEPMARGANFGGGQWLSSIGRAGSVLIVSGSTGYGNFLNRMQLVSGAAHPSLDLGGIYVNALAGVDLSADGQCAAAWAPSQDMEKPFDLHFLDAQHGDVKVHAAAEHPWFRF